MHVLRNQTSFSCLKVLQFNYSIASSENLCIYYNKAVLPVFSMRQTHNLNTLPINSTFCKVGLNNNSKNVAESPFSPLTNIVHTRNYKNNVSSIIQ